MVKKALLALGIIAVLVLVAKESELAANIVGAIAGGVMAVVNGAINIGKALFGG